SATIEPLRTRWAAAAEVSYDLPRILRVKRLVPMNPGLLSLPHREVHGGHAPLGERAYNQGHNLYCYSSLACADSPEATMRAPFRLVIPIALQAIGEPGG